jgi:hypothetical protein
LIVTVPVLAVTLVYAGIEMDMFDQVQEILPIREAGTNRQTG